MPHSQLAGQQLNVNDLPVIMEELNKVCVKWYNIGMMLQVEIDKLDAIKEQYRDQSGCLREALKIWLKTYPPSSTWGNILNALRSSTVGETKLAAELEGKFCSSDVAATHQLAPPIQAVTASQAHTWTMTLQSAAPLTQPPIFASPYSAPQPHHSHSPDPDYYPSATSHLVSTPFLSSPSEKASTTTSHAVIVVHPAYSRLHEVRPVPPTSRPAQPTTSQHLSGKFTRMNSFEKTELLSKHQLISSYRDNTKCHQRSIALGGQTPGPTSNQGRSNSI